MSIANGVRGCLWCILCISSTYIQSAAVCSYTMDYSAGDSDEDCPHCLLLIVKMLGFRRICCQILVRSLNEEYHASEELRKFGRPLASVMWKLSSGTRFPTRLYKMWHVLVRTTI